mgnify:CR=1 FL=1
MKKFKGMRESLKGNKEVSNSVAQEESDTHKTKDGSTSKKGLWYNINQKKKDSKGRQLPSRSVLDE